MAGDWIKCDICLPDKPEVIAMAAALAIDQDAVTGKLLRLWVWADSNTKNGVARNVGAQWIDSYVRTPGFAEAMQSVRWLVIADDSITFPNFNRHNGHTAKRRSTHAAQTKRRRAAKSCAQNVRTNAHQRREEQEQEKRTEETQASALSSAERSSLAQKEFSFDEREQVRLQCNQANEVLKYRTPQERERIAQTVIFCRYWLAERDLQQAIEATRLRIQRKIDGDRVAYYIGVIRGRWLEVYPQENHGTPDEIKARFRALLKTITVPDWLAAKPEPQDTS